MEDPFLTVPRIASELGVNEVTVRTWIRKGSLPAIRAGRTYRVRRSDLDRWVSMRTDGGDREPSPPATGPGDLETQELLVQVRLPRDER
jgi:putative molybdopterin biosynthesis protein